MVARRRITQKKFKTPKDGDMFLDHVASGRGDLVEKYLNNGGNPKVVNCKGETALHIAAAHHQNDILARLLPYFSEDELDVRDMYGLPVNITVFKYGNDIGAQLISNYYKTIKTKPYKFKNYSFKKSIKKEISNGIPITNPIVYPSGIQNRLSNQNLLSMAQNLQRAVNQNVNVIQKKPTKTLKKQSINVSNNELNTRVKKILNKYLALKPLKRSTKSEQNQLNEINKIKRIENLPNALQYLPEVRKGNQQIKQNKSIVNYNNSQLKTFKYNNPKQPRVVNSNAQGKSTRKLKKPQMVSQEIQTN